MKNKISGHDPNMGVDFYLVSYLCFLKLEITDESDKVSSRQSEMNSGKWMEHRIKKSTVLVCGRASTLSMRWGLRLVDNDLCDLHQSHMESESVPGEGWITRDP